MRIESWAAEEYRRSKRPNLAKKRKSLKEEASEETELVNVLSLLLWEAEQCCKE